MATRWRSRTALCAAVLPTAAAALAACGGGSGSGGSNGNGEAAKTPAQIVSDAQAATGAATSIHISGKGTSGGTPAQVDIVAGQGRGGGTISENGATFQIVLDAGTVYLKADAATWTKLSGATAARLLADKWIKTTTSNQAFAEVATVLDISQFVSKFSRSGVLTKGPVTSIDGLPAVPVTDHEADGGTLYVAATGTPYILAVRGSGSDQGTIRFDEYNTARFPPDPTGAVDLSTLEGNRGG